VLSARCCGDADDGLLLLPSCQAIGMAVHTPGESACPEELCCCVGGKKKKENLVHTFLLTGLLFGKKPTFATVNNSLRSKKNVIQETFL